MHFDAHANTWKIKKTFWCSSTYRAFRKAGACHWNSDINWCHSVFFLVPLWFMSLEPLLIKRKRAISWQKLQNQASSKQNESLCQHSGKAQNNQIVSNVWCQQNVTKLNSYTVSSVSKIPKAPRHCLILTFYSTLCRFDHPSLKPYLHHLFSAFVQWAVQHELTS